MARRDLVVIGGGSGGLVVASVAARLGLRVTLIEAEEQLGGDCLHYGCIPSKALIHAAKVAATVQRASQYGLEVGEMRPVDLARVNAAVRERIGVIQRHDAAERFRGYGCEVLFGAARFTGPDTVRVNGGELRARRIVVATGSSAFVPPIEGLDETGFITNREAFSLKALPTRLAVLGGGPVGVELAQAFARLGSQVTILQRGPRILPREEPEASAGLAALLAGEGIRLFTGAEVTAVHRSEGGKRLAYRTAEGETSLEADEVLVAVGRRPNISGLDLEAAGVAYRTRGIQVDARLRTSNRRVFACGDVCGPYLFTHMAEYQAGIVIANTAFRLPRRVDYRVVPWVTYTDPELARVGSTEAEARERHDDVEVMRFGFDEIDRAIVERETEGFVKLVTRRRRLLGATLLGAHAGELIPELVFSMQSRAKISTLSATIHPYPTRAQIHRRAVNSYYGTKLFGPLPQRLAKFLNVVFP